MEAAGRPGPDVLAIGKEVVEVGAYYLTAMRGRPRRQRQGKRQRPTMRRSFPARVVFEDVFAAGSHLPCSDELSIHPQAKCSPARCPGLGARHHCGVSPARPPSKAGEAGFSRRTISTPRISSRCSSRSALTFPALRSRAERVCWVTPRRRAASPWVRPACFRKAFNKAGSCSAVRTTYGCMDTNLNLYFPHTVYTLYWRNTQQGLYCRRAAPKETATVTGSGGAPGGIRTPDQWLRKPLLYPAELQARGCNSRMKRLKLYWQLVRGDRPIGWLLLLWPTWWGLWLAAGGVPPLWPLLVFSLGVWLTRSAGCVINDYADRWLDGQVERTRNRPLATGAVSGREALAVFAVLMLVAFALVLTLNRLTVYLSFVGIVLAMTYPYLKRYTYLPQVYLGMAFGWGIPMAFAAIQREVPPIAWVLYGANILWSTAYDTWYAMVDRDDDIRMGAKSTAILFGDLDLVA